MDWTWMIVGGAVLVGLWLWWRSRAVSPALPSQPKAVNLRGLDAIQTDLQSLIHRKQKIEAIKLVRQHTGMGLKEAKDYVEALESGGPLPFFEPPMADATLPEDLSAAIRELLFQNKPIEAIKLVRERTALGLKEAKEYVEAFAEGRPLPPLSKPQPSEIDHSQLDAEIRALLMKNQKIQAVKLTRERLGIGLKEAKDYVEALGRREYLG